ncbi:MAG: ptpA 1 [Planctomycetaceae bacterium]|nr:ptpA 1 [Planctomycetaceae bacterium]
MFGRVCCFTFLTCAWSIGFGCTINAADLDPRRPAAIEVENVPVIPSEVFQRLRQYQSVRQTRFRGWSPDGNGMLIQTQFGNTPQLHRVQGPGYDRLQLTFQDEPTDGRFVPGKSDAILLTLSAGGSENDQLYWQTFQDGKVKLLTDGKSRNLLGPVSHDGRFVVITSNRRNGRDMDVLLGDLVQLGTWTDLLQVNQQSWSPLQFSLDGQRLLLNRVVSINETYLAVFDFKTRKLTEIPPPDLGAEKNSARGKVAVGSAVFSKNGESVYLTSDAIGEFQHLARVNLKDMSYEWLTQDIPWDIDHLELDPRTGQLAFTANEEGSSVLYVFDPAAKDSPRRKLATPQGVISGPEFSPTSTELGFTLAPPNGPSEACAVDLADGDLNQWTESEVGGLNRKTFISPTRIQFPTFDGRQIPAYYFKPKIAGNKKVPVLINIHGGPESQYRPLFSGIDQYYLNELGIAVIYPNVRGSDGYGKTYLQLDNGPKREDSVKDIGALLDWIKLQPELDADNVAVNGASYGGYMVLASLVMHGDRIRAGIDSVGIANFITFFENTSEYRRDLRRVEYGDERDPAMRAIFEKISPAKNAGKIRSALLVSHGKNDPRVPFSEAKQIAPLVRQNGQDVWTVYAGNEGHGFRKRDNRDYYSAVVTLFLQMHLK